MTKKKTIKSTAESPSTTVLSVRFSETELEHLKEAAELSNQPPATFVREAACRTAMDTINAGRERKQTRAIEQIAATIATNLIEGRLVKEECFWNGDDIEYREVILRAIKRESSPDPTDHQVIKPVVLGDQEQEILTGVLEHAARPFAKALLDAISDLLAEKDDLGFTPIVDGGSS